MTNLLPLKEGCYYPIYNRANGIENLFRKKEDYQHFLQLLGKYILPIADIFVWVLMPNHFHLLIRIKEDMMYKYSKEDFKKLIIKNANAFGLADKNNPTTEIINWNDVKWQTIPLISSASERPDDNKGNIKEPRPTQHFSHLCNAHAKYINEKYKRHGSLFQRPFKRKIVESERYLKQLVLYIHNNPVHHGFKRHVENYLWSSYHTYLSQEPTQLCRSEVLNWFGDLQNFINSHHQYFGDFENTDPSDWLEED